jgi:hypothetical protein
MRKIYNHINKELNNEFLKVYELINETINYKNPVTNSLKPKLDDKQEELVDGVNLKTINGESVQGPGNLTITGTGTGTSNSYFPSGW